MHPCSDCFCYFKLLRRINLIDNIQYNLTYISVGDGNTMEGICNTYENSNIFRGWTWASYCCLSLSRHNNVKDIVSVLVFIHVRSCSDVRDIHTTQVHGVSHLCDQRTIDVWIYEVLYIGSNIVGLCVTQLHNTYFVYCNIVFIYIFKVNMCC